MRHEDKLQILAAHKPVSLADAIRGLGIHVPDQSKVETYKEAMRLGFLPTVSARRVRMAWLRRLGRTGVRWVEFQYEEFSGNNMLNRDYGGSVPRIVQHEVQLIKGAMPDADVRVLAIFEDPLLKILWRGQVVITRGWTRRDGVVL